MNIIAERLRQYAQRYNPDTEKLMLDAAVAVDERDKLRAALVGIVGAESKGALIPMKEYVQKSSAPDDIKEVTITAIDALLETMTDKNECIVQLPAINFNRHDETCGL